MPQSCCGLRSCGGNPPRWHRCVHSCLQRTGSMPRWRWTCWSRPCSTAPAWRSFVSWTCCKSWTIFSTGPRQSDCSLQQCTTPAGATASSAALPGRCQRKRMRAAPLPLPAQAHESGAIAAVSALCDLPITSGARAGTVFEQLQLATERAMQPTVLASLTDWLLAEADPWALKHDEAVRAMTGAMFSGKLTALHHWCRLVSQQWPEQQQEDSATSRAVAQLLQAGVCCKYSRPLAMVVQQMAAHVRQLPAALAADVLCLAIQVGQPAAVELLAAQPWACLQGAAGLYDTSSSSLVSRVLSAAVQRNSATAIQLLHAQLVACGRALPAVTVLPAVHLAVQLRAQAALHALCALPARKDLPGDSLRALHSEAVHASVSLGVVAASAAAAFHNAAAAGTLQAGQLKALHRAMCWHALGLSQAAPAADSGSSSTLFNALLGPAACEPSYTASTINAAALRKLAPGGLMALLRAAITCRRQQLFVFVWRVAARQLSADQVAELLLAAVSADMRSGSWFVQALCQEVERLTRRRLLPPQLVIFTQHVLPAAMAAAQLGQVVALQCLCRLPVKYDSGAEIPMADVLPQASLQHLLSITAFTAGRNAGADVAILGPHRRNDEDRGSAAAMFSAVAAGATPGVVRRCRPQQQLCASEVFPMLMRVARTYSGDAREQLEVLGIISDCCAFAPGRALRGLTPEQLALVTAEFEFYSEDLMDGSDGAASVVADVLARLARAGGSDEAAEGSWVREGRQRLRRWLQEGRC